MKELKLKNFMEDVVFQILDEILMEKKDFCSCERCKMDIAAIALNHLPPKYTVTESGEVFTKVELLSQQFRADALVEILKAIEIVSRKPHH
ncbi:MAG: late competence development ComFB family protein [Thermovenabulum sp.]|uniref:late competence development ComFB family protein n=1 Tax=Thermovenabulum sp. TaxID=3100335 RepID=UPI003C7C83B6